MVKGHVWAILAVLVAMIVVLILAMKAKKGKKHVIRWSAVLACIAAITLIANMMCYGPLYNNVSSFLNASKAELSEETIKAVFYCRIMGIMQKRIFLSQINQVSTVQTSHFMVYYQKVPIISQAS